MTTNAMSVLQRNHVTGVTFDKVTVSRSEIFNDLYPGRELPHFVWMKPIGVSGKDDIGLASDNRLMVSEKALDLLQRLGLANANIEPVQK